MHAEAIASVEGAHLAVACSRTPETARRLAEEYGAAWCTDFRQAVGRPDVDAVTVCTPSGLHAGPALVSAIYEAARTGHQVRMG
jgi:UDP-N-acetyl-2-amino-2-deoxyglucuronate dehydrogenase